MCGVFGLFGDFSDEFREMAAQVADTALAHRGPDTGNSVVRGKGLLHVRRLAIMDMSTRGSQPLSVGNDDVWLAYNGMLYNHREIRDQLRHVHEFRSFTDTEVVAAALTRWGSDALRRFEGMFALLWWDSQRSELVAAVDHLAIKPLLWFQDSKGRIACSSEIGPLVDLFPEITIDVDSLGTYLATGLIDHSERTLLRGVRQLRHGQVLRWSPRGVSVARYRDLIPESPSVPERSRPGLSDDLHLEMVRCAVRRHLASDAPLGLALSSGVDSNLLRRVVDAEMKPDEVPSIVHCFTGTDYDESRRLELFSGGDALGATRVEIDVGMVPELMPAQIERTLEPIGGLGVFAASQTYRVAAEMGLRVMLTGEGADELFGGYSYYREIAASANASNSLPRRHEVRAPDGTVLEGPPLAQAFRFERVVPESGGPIDKSLVRSRLRCAMWDDLVALKLPKLLRFQDRMSMLSGVEARAPFLDLPLVIHSLALHDTDLVSGGESKIMLRRLLRRMGGPQIPAEKFDVSAPQREWVKGALGTWIADLSLDSLLIADGIVDGGAFRQKLHAYRSTPHLGNSFFAWQFMSLELWYRAVITRGARRRRRPR